MSIKERILSSKIQRLQIDLFGYCNAKCWFCPVRYIEQPLENRVHMPIELVEKIFADLAQEKNRLDGFVDSSFDTFIATHYSEVLLYKHFEELLDLARKFNLKTYVLTNGIALNKQKVNLIREYNDVVTHVGINVPAFQPKVWAKRTGFTEDHFDILMKNIRFAGLTLSHLKENFRIHVNGVDDSLVGEENPNYVSCLTKGSDFDDSMDLSQTTGEHETQFKIGKNTFPGITIDKSILLDRAGFVSNVFTNELYIKQLSQNRPVVGCDNWGDRITEWLHISSLGDAFLCCNDYNFEHKFGNFNNQCLRDMWGSDAHIQMAERAMKSICTKCIDAKYGD